MKMKVLCGLLAAVIPALGFAATVTPDDVDLPACKILQAGAVVGGGEPAARAILFERQAAWKPNSAPGGDAPVQYVIAFRRAVPVGTVMALDVDEIAVAKPDSANAWMILPIASPRGGRLRLALLPPDTMVRAVRLTQSWKNTRNQKRQLNMVRLPAERFVNAAADGIANADAEFWPADVPEKALRAQCAITGEGRGAWQNTAPPKGKNVDRTTANRPPISAAHPSWFILSWIEPQSLTGLWLETSASAFNLYAYDGPAGVNPAAALKNEWRKLDGWRRCGPANALISFDKPVNTRGVRIEFTGSVFDKNAAIVRVDGLQAFVPAGRQTRVVAAGGGGEKPPVVLEVPVPPGTGTASVVIETPDGKRVRNLAARRPVKGGSLPLPWDLRDENGLMVTPGDYVYRSLWLPELSVKYQMTVYPNVEMNSTNSPWMNGYSGPGSWLGDHSAPSSVAVSGNRIFFGCQGAEEGVALIECDFEGRKLWGHREFGPSHGPSCLAGDGERLYLGLPRWEGASPSQKIARIKVSTREDERPLAVMRPEAGRLLGLQAIAVYQDRLYAAVKASTSGAKLDPSTQRVDVYSTKDKSLLKTFAVPNPTDIKFAKDGTCYVISDGKVVLLDTVSGAVRPLELDAIKPGSLALDADGLLYVWDAARDRMNIRVFDARAGRLVRTIGTPGGYKPGPWDPTRIAPSPATRVQLAIDPNGKLWVLEATFLGKRITRWSRDGKVEKELLGNPRYGGGATGSIDPWDKSRLFLATRDGTLEFNIDWKSGASRIKNLAGMGMHGGGSVLIRAYGHEYLAQPGATDFQSGVQRLYLYRGGVSRLAAAIGWVKDMPELMNREILAKMGKARPESFYFIWSDMNLDGKPQADEVQLFPIKEREFPFSFDRTLRVFTAHARYDVAKVLGNGVPLYKRTSLKGTAFDGLSLQGLPDGSLVGRSKGKWVGVDAAGNIRWTWQTAGFGGQSCTHGKPFYSPDESVAEMIWCGAEQAPAGDLGTFFVTCHYFGCYTIWTADGFLAGRIFTDIRDPKRLPWNMPDHLRGLELQGVTLSDEHYSGFFTRTFEDNKYYVTAGKHHVSVAEVVGLDKAKRGTGPVKVTLENVRTAMAQTAAAGQRKVYATAPVLRVPRLTPKIGGKSNDWPRDGFTRLNSHVRFQIAYDAAHLYARWEVNGLGPFKNSGTDYHSLYKTGAGVDLHLGADPQADARRKSPVAGDLRILIAPMAGKAVAVLYEPVDPAAPADLAWDSSTGVARMRFDRVELLTRAALHAEPRQDGYVVEASIPFAALGADRSRHAPEVRRRRARSRRRRHARSQPFVLGEQIHPIPLRPGPGVAARTGTMGLVAHRRRRQIEYETNSNHLHRRHRHRNRLGAVRRNTNENIRKPTRACCVLPRARRARTTTCG